VSLARLYEDKFSPTFKPSNGPNTNKYQPHNLIPIQQQSSQPKQNLPPLLPTPPHRPILKTEIMSRDFQQ